MIPLRIQVTGFLCYRETQEACFDGRTVWMLAGPNGSGKSALFDAVTYALFGQHRGGKHHTRELIHHDCQQLVIEFDFAIGQERFRAHRTLSRQGRSTRQILTHSSTDTGDQTKPEAWTAVADTHTERGFARWIEAHIALSYETFTASVLLLQGKADNLLLATSTQRHRLLCQLVGLDRFEKLAQRANQQQVQMAAQRKACQQQLEQMAPVDEECIAQRRQELATTLHQIKEQSHQIDELRQTLRSARAWQRLTHELELISNERDQNAQRLRLLKQSSREQHRRAEEAANLAALKRWHEYIQRIAQCQADIERLHADQQANEAQLERCDSRLRNATDTLVKLQQQLTDVTTQEKRIAKQHAEQTAACSTAVQFAQARDKLQQLCTEQNTLRERLKSTQHQQNKLQQTMPTEPSVQAARENVAEVREQLAQYRVQVDQVRSQLARLQKIAHESTCPYCQQPLDLAHSTQLTKHLEQQLQNLEASLRRARDQHHAASELEQQLQKDQLRYREQYDVLIRSVATIVATLEGNAIVEQELVEQCAKAYQDMPLAHRQEIAKSPNVDWAMTTALSAAEIDAMRSAANKSARTLEQLTHTRQMLEKAFHESKAEQQQITEDQHAIRQRLDQCRQQLAEQRGQWTGLVELESAARAHVPQAWHDRTADELVEFIESLATDSAANQAPANMPPSTGACAADLEQLEQQSHKLQARHDILSKERSSLPPTARKAPEQIETQLNDCRQCADQLDMRRCKLDTTLADAIQQRKRYEAANEQLREAERQHRLWKRVATLLGRDGLQRMLLESAERAIVQYANAILDRLAAGALYLEIASPKASRRRERRALDLVARVPGNTCHSVEVAFLSGSQKFRVAVALSLAIGQFASNTRRPVQAVIIDEGFGCLDTTNRQVMVQELHNLQGYLQRILLVSHQDEFVNAFPDGYRCEMIDGATRLIRFHK